MDPQPTPIQPAQSTSKLPLILSIIVALVLVGLGSFYAGLQAGKTMNQDRIKIFPAPTITTTSSPSPTAVQQQSGWKTYTNTQYGYSISYPENWYNLPNFGAPTTDKYFSNQNVGAPLEMQPGGIWVTLKVQTASSDLESLFTSPVGVVRRQPSIITKLSDLVINNNVAVQYTSEPSPQGATEAAYSLNYAIKHGNQIITISFVTANKSDSDKNIQTFDQMAKTLQFTN